MVSRGQFRAWMAPLRLLIGRRLGHGTQGSNGAAISPDCCTRNLCPRRLIHERHEFIRKSRHGASDADSAYVGAPADSGHPSPFGYVAVHHGPPASQLHDALGRAVHFGKITLLVVTGAIAA